MRHSSRQHEVLSWGPRPPQPRLGPWPPGPPSPPGKFGERPSCAPWCRRGTPNVSPTNNTTHTLFGYSQKEKKFLTKRMPKHVIFLLILISFHKTSEIIQLTVTRKYCMYMATKVKFRWTDDDHEVKDDPITLPCKCTGEKIRKNIVHHSKSSPSRWISNVGDTSNGLALSSYTKQLHVCKNKTDKHPLLTCPHMFKLNGCLIWQKQCIFLI